MQKNAPHMLVLIYLSTLIVDCGQSLYIQFYFIVRIKPTFGLIKLTGKKGKLENVKFFPVASNIP